MQLRKQRLSTLDFSDPVKRARVTVAIIETLQESFIIWPLRNMTEAEKKTRFNILMEGYKHLRDDLGLSTQRCIDNLPNILQAFLDKDQSVLRNHNREYWVG
jgi:hypothetical protein